MAKPKIGIVVGSTGNVGQDGLDERVGNMGYLLDERRIRRGLALCGIADHSSANGVPERLQRQVATSG